MPIFEIQSDAGTFQVDAPDQASAVDALSSATAAPGDSFSGSAKALGVGVAKGAISLAGLPGDAASLASWATNGAIGSKGKDFGSEAIQHGIEKYTGEFYKPQTTLEKGIDTVGSFLPAALAGPGGIGRRVLTQAVIPGVASETAGQLAEGTGFEPVARIAGALGGAVAGSKLASVANAPKAAALPTNVENAAVKTAGYQSQAIKDLEINPTYATKVADAGLSKIARFSEKNPEVAEVKDILEKLKKPETGYTHRLDTDFEASRRLLQGIAGKGGSGGEAARLAVNTIDAGTLRIPQSAVVAGDARAASRAMQEGRQAAAVEFRTKKIQDVLEKAMNTASATHSGGNLENEIYKQVRTMLNNPRVHLRGWSQEERDALKAVLPGMGSNALRRAGKLMGGGGGLGQLASGAAGTAMFGPAGMIALPALGMAANKLGSSMAKGRLGAVEQQLLSRSPAYSKANQAQRRSIQNAPMLGLPPREQMALQALIAARLQSPDYAGR